jgi:hypothetical protein
MGAQHASIAVVDGRARPEFGPDVYEVRCLACRASWCGFVEQSCPWCARAEERQREVQAELLLRVEVDRDDEDGLRAWAERLRVGVRAGIVTKDQARNAWRRVFGPGVS